MNTVVVMQVVDDALQLAQVIVENDVSGTGR